jgi:hypothetical protein
MEYLLRQLVAWLPNPQAMSFGAAWQPELEWLKTHPFAIKVVAP